MKLEKTLSGIEISPESLLTIPRGKLASSAHYKHLCRNISCTDSLQTSVRLMVEGKVTNMSAKEERRERNIACVPRTVQPQQTEHMMGK